MTRLISMFRLNHYLLVFLLFSCTLFLSASLVSATAYQERPFQNNGLDVSFSPYSSLHLQQMPYYTVEKETHVIEDGNDTFIQKIVSIYNREGELVEQQITDKEEYVYFFENGMETTTIQTVYKDGRMISFEQKNVRDIEYSRDDKDYSLLEKEYFDIWERPVRKISKKTIDDGNFIHQVKNVYLHEELQELTSTRITPLEKGEEKRVNQVFFDEQGGVRLRRVREYLRKPVDDLKWKLEEKVYTYEGGDELVRRDYISEITSSDNNIFMRNKKEEIWDKVKDEQFTTEIEEKNERYREENELRIVRNRKRWDSRTDEMVESRQEYTITESHEQDRFLERKKVEHFENDELIESTEKDTYRYADYQIKKIVEYSYFDQDGQYHGGERILYYPDKTVSLLFDPDHAIVERTITYTYLPQ